MNILDKDYKMKVTPEQSRAVQEACFAHGIIWSGNSSKSVAYNCKPYLYIRAVGAITFGDEGEEEYFNNSKLCPIEPEAFIAMMNNKPKGHPHAELMAQYAEDAAESATPWERWEYFSDSLQVWESCIDHPYWATRTLFRRKSDTIKVGKHEFPRPMQTAPAGGTIYWYVTLVDGKFEAYGVHWTAHTFDTNNLKAGLCHPTREAAEQHAAVLNAINRGDV